MIRLAEQSLVYFYKSTLSCLIQRQRHEGDFMNFLDIQTHFSKLSIPRGGCIASYSTQALKHLEKAINDEEKVSHDKNL